MLILYVSVGVLVTVVIGVTNAPAIKIFFYFYYFNSIYIKQNSLFLFIEFGSTFTTVLHSLQ